jgi:hypothetical protein
MNKKGNPNWGPGRSGNPSGRPKMDPELKEAAKALTMDALKTLETVMKSTKAPFNARVNAASVILDRGHGKAPQHITTERLDSLTDDELAQRIAEASAELRELGWGDVLDAEGGSPSQVRPH